MIEAEYSDKQEGRFYFPDLARWLGPDRQQHTKNKAEAEILNYGEWLRWGEDCGYDFEPLPPDEAMQRAGAQRLPGL